MSLRVTPSCSVEVEAPATGLRVAPACLPGITPDSFPGIIAWWKADSYSLPDSTVIGDSGNEWIDQTGNNHDGEQATPENRPVFKTNVFGSKPAVKFGDGDADTYFDFLPIIDLPGEFTILAVVRDVFSDSMIMGHTVNKQIRMQQEFFGNPIGISMFDGSNPPIGINSLDQPTPIGDPKLVVYAKDAVTNVKFYSNNGIDISAGGLSPGPMNLSRIGEYNILGVQNFKGYIAELLVYGTLLSQADVQSLYTGYLKARWSLP
jgi:hypothetical protein